MINKLKAIYCILIVLGLTAAECASDPTATPTFCDETIGQQVASRFNAARAADGLAPLTVDLRLVQAALGHSQDMAGGDFVGHAGSDGSTPGVRIDRVGYDWSYFSENVAAGQITPEIVVDAWMGSPGHRANILSTDALNLGVGYVLQPGTDFEFYWTVNFGATTGTVAVPTDGCHP